MPKPIYPRYVPIPYQDSTESGRLILRDGTTAQVRLAGPEDAEALQAFFARLSLEARRHRFFSAAVPRVDFVASLCENCDPRRGLTLVVHRAQGVMGIREIGRESRGMLQVSRRVSKLPETVAGRS